VKLSLPAVFSIDDITPARNTIQQISECARTVEGAIATFTRDRLHGYLFNSAEGRNSILLVPEKSKQIPETYKYVVETDEVPTATDLDASKGHWLRHPSKAATSNPAGNEEAIQQVLDSWNETFSYIQEDKATNTIGLRKPQIGALHAIHAHWAVSDSTATIVMPTGTGKTETMLSILITARCSRLLVVVPTDSLRAQITEKFLTLGILKAKGSKVVKASALHPIVCRLEHVPISITELDDLFRRAQVIITTSSIAGQCAEGIQARFAHHCPYLFIDEAHHAEAPTWKEFKKHFSGRRIVQFTATPFREDDRPLDGTIVFKYPLKLAQKEDYFRAIHFEPIIEFDLRRSDEKIAAKALECLRREFDRGHIVMARAESVSRAKQVFELYRQYKEFNPVQLHSGITSQKQREAVRQQIISGASRIIVCVDMLGEGFDLPQLKIAAFHDIRKSLAVTLQLAGRFTRARADLGEATFIANVGDVNVQEELRKLYTRDPDWNVLLPELSEKMIGEQRALQDFVNGFTDLPEEIPLKAVEPATSVVIYKTRCENWLPERFRDGIPDPDGCERIYHSINHREQTLVVVTARRAVLIWTNAENLYNWIWDLYVVVWSPEQNVLYLNGSSNAGEFNALAQAVTNNQATIIKGQEVFRSFAGINRLKLHNVGLTDQIGRNVRYTGSMGSNVEPRLTQAQLGSSLKTVLDGSGFKEGAAVTVGASRKGRIWSHRRERIDKFKAWCKQIGEKVLDRNIDPDVVLEGTLRPQVISERPAKMPVRIDWPEIIWTEPEAMWFFELSNREVGISDVSINLVRPSINGRLLFEIVTDEFGVEIELELFTHETVHDYRFLILGDDAARTKHGRVAPAKGLAEFFYNNPPTIWFADGSSLEGDEYTELRNGPPPYDARKIQVWDWNGINIMKESQGEERQQDSVQARAIQEVLGGGYDVIFDDDGAGEAADIVAIHILGGVNAPTAIDIALYHCKYSIRPLPGHRIDDLYVVCGQAQKSIGWVTSDRKKSDIFTHLLRREKDRINNGRTTRFEVGDIDLLQTIREMSYVLPVSISVSIVQPGLSCAEISPDQLQLLGVTENYLMETYQLPFQVIASA
jgi:superfamily II DNA or RNA helicase